MAFIEWFWIHLRWRLYKFAMRFCLGLPCGDWDRVVYLVLRADGGQIVAPLPEIEKLLNDASIALV